ncbi:MAG: SDR family NAD(P)-dependent oxidoreductase [Chloroflexi bacterium]|nr:SDR family NAD(P)-dependent oxidoreductase [Chloroflexota bacterium]
MDLAGKVAIVTGSSRGLGKATAVAFARAGAAVVVAARTEEPHPRIAGTIRQTADEVRAFGGTALAIRCNMGSAEEVEELVKRTLEEFGHVDILVHNAAANLPGGVADLDLRRWEILFNVNVRALFILARAAVASMKAQGGGRILAVAPKPDLSAQTSIYIQAKQALTHLTLGMAKELAPFGIAANCLWPGGPRDTEGMQAISGGQYGNTSPQLFADAALAIVTKDPRTYTGRTVTDEEVLREEGVSDFSRYLRSREATQPDRYTDSR